MITEKGEKQKYAKNKTEKVQIKRKEGNWKVRERGKRGCKKTVTVERRRIRRERIA